MNKILNHSQSPAGLAANPVSGTEVMALADKVIATGEGVSEAEAVSLAAASLDALKDAAERITKACASRRFDTCSIINGKSGKCPEDCKWCAQSAHYYAHIHEYPLVSAEKLEEAAEFSRSKGIGRFSIVTSGKRLKPGEVEQLCSSVRELAAKTDIRLCLSAGLLSEEDLRIFREVGISRYHCNLESSPSFFGRLCTTHTQEEKISTLKAAVKAGLEICSGGIIGMGERTCIHPQGTRCEVCPDKHTVTDTRHPARKPAPYSGRGCPPDNSVIPFHSSECRPALCRRQGASVRRDDTGSLSYRHQCIHHGRHANDGRRRHRHRHGPYPRCRLRPVNSTICRCLATPGMTRRGSFADMDDFYFFRLSSGRNMT